METSDAAPARFVILTAPRTGSNYFCTLLNSHPQILCHHELFNPNVVGAARDFRNVDAIGTIQQRERDPGAFLERVWTVSAGHRCVGFKLCWRQHHFALQAVLRDAGVKKIVMKRHNQVKSFVSLALARHTGEWVVYIDAPRPAPRPKIAIDPRMLLETIAYNREYYAEVEAVVKATGQETLEIHYEQFCSREVETVAETLRFLGVEDGPIHTMRGQSWKLTPLALSETIANFDELAASLRGTPLEAQLYTTSF